MISYLVDTFPKIVKEVTKLRADHGIPQVALDKLLILFGDLVNRNSYFKYDD